MISDLKVYVSDTFLKCNKVILIPHNNPDFDAIGSAAGLTLIAKKLKKESKIIINDNLSMIDPGVKIIVDELNRESNLIIDKNKYVKEKNDNDLFVLTDVNKRNLISVNDLLNNNTLIIDHHNEDENTVKASYKYINTKMSSASEIVTKLISMLKIKIPSSIANYLLAGIYLDTNKLTKNTSSDTFKTVSKLIDSGASINRVSDFFTEDFTSDRRVQNLVNRLDINHYAVGTIIADENEIVEAVELAKAADYSLRYGLDAVFAMGKISDDVISISARSKGMLNVGEVMSQLQGGGNEHSGATKIKDESIEEVGTKLKKLLKNPYYI